MSNTSELGTRPRSYEEGKKLRAENIRTTFPHAVAWIHKHMLQGDRAGKFDWSLVLADDSRHGAIVDLGYIATDDFEQLAIVRELFVGCRAIRRGDGRTCHYTVEDPSDTGVLFRWHVYAQPRLQSMDETDTVTIV